MTDDEINEKVRPFMYLTAVIILAVGGYLLTAGGFEFPFQHAS